MTIFFGINILPFVSGGVDIQSVLTPRAVLKDPLQNPIIINVKLQTCKNKSYYSIKNLFKIILKHNTIHQGNYIQNLWTLMVLTEVIYP